MIRLLWISIVARLAHRLILTTTREPDITIGGEGRPYLRRWYLFRVRWFGSVYLHQFLRSDDDRALHDHPWINCSVLLSGTYVEHTISAGGIHRRQSFTIGDVKFRVARAAHRIEIDQPCWSLFLTGPVIRNWGFHCPDAGWVAWQTFTNPEDGGRTVGRGCE